LHEHFAAKNVSGCHAERSEASGLLSQAARSFASLF
jgi:hypothetical protein